MPGERPACLPRSPCRRTKRGSERCERVIAVAGELFLEYGYDRVSLDDIIAKAGGSKTNIYSHFGGKEGLFLTVIEGLCDEINGQICAVDVTGLSLEDGLRRLGQVLLESLLKERHLALYRLVIGESKRFPAIGCAWRTHGPEASQAILAVFIAGHQTGETRLSPRRGAQLFHDMLVTDHLEQAVFGLRDAHDPHQTARAVDDAVTLFIQGYA